MTVILVILSVYFLNWVLEVYHDDVLRRIRLAFRIALKQLEKLGESMMLSWKLELELSNEWHRFDWKAHALIACLVTGLVVFYEGDWSDLALAPAIGLQRMMVLNIGGNIKSKIRKKNGKRDLLHLGEGMIDKTLSSWFGSFWIVAVLTLFLGLISLMIWV